MIIPQLKVAFDSGRCPQRCVYADTLCLSHTHMVGRRHLPGISDG